MSFEALLRVVKMITEQQGNKIGSPQSMFEMQV
jgi:hypothetical protein